MTEERDQIPDEETKQEPADEEIMFASFLSDYEPSFIIMLTYSPTRLCSYLRIVKIYNAQEFEEDLISHQQILASEGDDFRTYSQVEDELKRELIENLRENLANEPSVTGAKHAAFAHDNI